MPRPSHRASVTSVMYAARHSDDAIIAITPLLLASALPALDELD